MSDKPASRWSENKGLARAILHDRTMRRRVMSRFLLLLIFVFALGLWGIPDWLNANIWRFFLYWAACGALTLFILIFAVFDACAVIREERDRSR
jgi:polyferredoxin